MKEKNLIYAIGIVFLGFIYYPLKYKIGDLSFYIFCIIYIISLSFLTYKYEIYKILNKRKNKKIK